MPKKVIFAYLVLFVSLLFFVTSYMKWNHQIKDAQSQGTEVNPPIANIQDDQEPVDEEDIEIPVDTPDFISLIKNQDEKLQALFSKRQEADGTINMLIIGSTAMEDGNPGYAERLQNALKKSYEDFIDTTIVSYEGNSLDFLESNFEAAQLTEKYDVVLMEPFTLTNNGVVTIEDEHAQIDAFNQQLLAETEDALLILQPPHPIYGATYYPSQVDALQNFAATNGYLYINHWTDWPSTEDESLKDFLTDDSYPNEDGAEIWANTLITYFTGK